MNINKEILRLAVPSILANLTVPLVGLVDLSIVGHISNATAIGGIAIGTMLFDLLYWNFGFLRVGTGGMTAQAFGRQDYGGQIRLLAQAQAIAGGSAILIWLIQWFFVQAVLLLTDCTPEVAQFARSYFYIRVWAAPATLMLMGWKGWFIGMQDTRSPMLVDITVNGVNMLLSYYLAVRTPIGALGVAWGTLIAQYTGLLLAMSLFALRYRRLLVYLQWRTALHWNELRDMMKLNKDLILRSLGFMVIYVGYTQIATRYGDQELAASALYMKVCMLVSFFADGFAYAAEAMVGRYIGARKPAHLRRTIIDLFVWMKLIGVASMLLFMAYGRPLYGLLTTDVEVLRCCFAQEEWLWLMPMVGVLAFLEDGICVGMTDAKSIRNCMYWAAAGFVLTYAVGFWWMGIAALYAAYVAHLLVRAVYLAIKLRKKIPDFLVI